VTGDALATIAALAGARRARHVARIQPLWSGYGEVSRVALDGGPAPTAIVKHVRPPRAARATTSDARKRRSYDVEIAFYRTHAARCDAACRVARLYGAHVEADGSLGAWQTVAALPMLRTNHELAVVGDYLVLMGGAGMGPGDTTVLTARVRHPTAR